MRACNGQVHAHTALALLIAIACAGNASAQTGPVVTVDAVAQGAFDTNARRSDDPIEAYGGGGELRLRLANRLRAPTLQLEYAAGLWRSAPEDPQDGHGHRLNALAGVPLARWLRLDVIGRGRRGGVDEDMATVDEVLLSGRIELQPLRSTRLRGHGAHRWQETPAIDTASVGQYAGVELRQRIGRSTTVLADARYEQFHAPDSTRDWQRQGITFGVGQAIFGNTAIEAEVRFRERDYPLRLVDVNGTVEPRRDSDRRFGLALVYDNGAGTEIRLEVEREERYSNDADRAYDAQRARILVRQRLFSLGGRSDPPRIDERPGTDAVRGRTDASAAPGRFTGVRVAGTSLCGIVADGALCWPAPGRSVAAGPQLVPGSWQQIEAASGRACGLDAEGVVHCWMWQTDGAEVRRSAPVPTGVRFTRIAVGPAHTCALTAAGAAYCWGENREGQLGTGLAVPADAPVAAATEARFTSITAGSRHTCALDTAGVAQCWGANESGQAAAGAARRILRPTPVTGHTFVAVSAGARHTCALTTDGRAFCWGESTSGQAGLSGGGIAQRPVLVESDVRFTSITAGWAHTCALSSAGRPFCWGSNRYGQLGTGRTDADTHPLPEPVTGDHAFAALSASFRTCALDAQRHVFCWGGSGQDAVADARAARPGRIRH